MNLLVALLFALSVIVDAPAVCAHALGDIHQMGGSHEMTEAAMHIHSEHPTAHPAHHSEMPSDDLESGHPHDGCPEGCKGGLGCDGCAMTSASLRSLEDSVVPLPTSLHGSGVVADLFGRLSVVEPPPPRT